MKFTFPIRKNSTHFKSGGKKKKKNRKTTVIAEATHSCPELRNTLNLSLSVFQPLTYSPLRLGESPPAEETRPHKLLRCETSALAVRFQVCKPLI